MQETLILTLSRSEFQKKKKNKAKFENQFKKIIGTKFCFY